MRSLKGPGNVYPFSLITLRYTHELVRNVRRQNVIAKSEFEIVSIFALVY
jgi:hypothetical protein